MTLSFTQIIDGLPNYFIEKIWASLLPNGNLIGEYISFLESHKKLFGKDWEFYSRNQDPAELGLPPFHEKMHTIRANRHSKWRAGMDIHFVINNRQKNRFQFAPVVKCISCQEIWILKFNDDLFGIKIDGRNLAANEVLELAVNDGFDSATDFYKYFLTDSEFGNNYYGKIIHWTDKRY